MAVQKSDMTLEQRDMIKPLIDNIYWDVKNKSFWRLSWFENKTTDPNPNNIWLNLEHFPELEKKQNVLPDLESGCDVADPYHLQCLFYFAEAHGVNLEGLISPGG